MRLAIDDLRVISRHLRGRRRWMMTVFGLVAHNVAMGLVAKGAYRLLRRSGLGLF